MTRTTAIGTAALVVMLGCGLAGAETFEQAATAKGYTYASTDNINVWAYDAADPGGTKMPGDVTSLAGVENYTACSGIIASHNQITSIATNQFAGMSNVTDLFLDSNQIAGIEPGDLAGLSSLEGLYLADNQIADIDSIRYLVELTHLHLSRNEIVDIEPLVGNKGLGKGDNVSIHENSLNCSDPQTLEYIDILEQRGVELLHDC